MLGCRARCPGHPGNRPTSHLASRLLFVQPMTWSKLFSLTCIVGLPSACASATPATVAPHSSAPVTTAAATPQAGPQPRKSHDRYVGLQLFVLDTRGPATESALPPPLAAAAGCHEHACVLVSAPVLLAHSRAPMQLEVGNLTDEQRFTVRARGFARNSTVELDVQANIRRPDQALSLEFNGVVTPGGVTHLGTLQGRDGSGPELFAVVTSGTIDEATGSLKAWHGG